MFRLKIAVWRWATRKNRERQEPLWYRSELPEAPGHPFYKRLNGVLERAQFDGFSEEQCRPFYPEKLGRPSLPPGMYFRLMMIGFFEGIDSERGIAWRVADSLALRLPRSSKIQIGSVDPDAWKIPARRAEYSLTENARSPFHAEPGHTREDFTRLDQRYDIILDSIANHSLFAGRRVLTPTGKYIFVGGPSGRWIGPLTPAIKALTFSPFVSQQFTMVLARSSQADLALIGELMQSGKVTPVIDRRYSLREAPEAIRYVEQGHARGKVIVTLDPA